MGSKSHPPRASVAGVAAFRLMNPGQDSGNDEYDDIEDHAGGEAHADHEEAAELSQHTNSADADQVASGDSLDPFKHSSGSDKTSTPTSSSESRGTSRRSMFTPLENPEDSAFRDYLKRIRFIDTLTKSIISLYEMVERPDNAIEHFLTLLAEGKDVVAEILDSTALELLGAELRILEVEKAGLVEKVEKHKAEVHNNHESGTEDESTEEEGHYV